MKTFLMILLCFLPLNAMAQESLPTVASTLNLPETTRVEISKEEIPDFNDIKDQILQLQVSMADNSYRLNKNLESKSRLLSVLEKVLYSICLTEVANNLKQSGANKNETCSKYVSQILNLDAGNVVAICVRDGIDSRTCRYASENQKTNTYDPEREQKDETAQLDDVVTYKKEQQKIQEETDSLYNNYSTLEYSEKNKKNILERKQIISKILSLNCARSRIRLEKLTEETQKSIRKKSTSLIDYEPETSESSERKPTAVPVAKDDAFTELLNKHFKTPTPTVTIAESFRIYEITSDCNRYLEEAFKLDANLPAAQCYKWGFYSWQCINAKRIEMKSLSAKPSENFTRPAGNISSF